MAKIYIAQVDFSENAPYASLLHEGFLKGAERYKRAEDRARSFCCRWLLFSHLQKEGVDPTALVLSNTDLGKPFVCLQNFHFSFAHSGALSVLMVNDRSCGVDVEAVRRGKDTDGLAKRVLSERELDTYFSSKNKEEAFTAFFTKKEAEGKRQGTGILPRMAGEIDVSNTMTVRLFCREEVYFLSYAPALDCETILMEPDLKLEKSI